MSHLNQTYTWYGVNGVQYDISLVSRRARLGSIEEWVVVNKRLGRGEGEAGCPPPTETSDDYTSKTEGRGEIGGNRRLHGSRTAATSQPEARNGDKKDDAVEGAGLGELAEAGGGGMVDCSRGGSGKPTEDTHPFHLHVNHFQVRNSGEGRLGSRKEMMHTFESQRKKYTHASETSSTVPCVLSAEGLVRRL